MPQTPAEKIMTAALEDADIGMIGVRERDDGELRVVHQLSDSDGPDQANLDVGRVAGAFLSVYGRTGVDRLGGVIVSADGDHAATYRCREEWAIGAATDGDPRKLTEKGHRAVEATRQTIGDQRPVDDVEALLEEM